MATKQTTGKAAKTAQEKKTTPVAAPKAPVKPAAEKKAPAPKTANAPVAEKKAAPDKKPQNKKVLFVCSEAFP